MNSYSLAPRGSILTPNAAASDVERAQSERLDAKQIAALAVCAAGFAFDLAELAFGNILSTVFSHAPHMATPTELSWLLAAVYIGAIVGAPSFGILADRIGRRTTLAVLLGMIAIGSLLCAAAGTVGQLIPARLFTGIALGAYPPVMFAYLAEILPRGRRGRAIVLSNAFSYLGPPALIFLVRSISGEPLGLEGWRWGFVVAGVGAAVCAILSVFLPESRPWSGHAEHTTAAAGTSFEEPSRSRALSLGALLALAFFLTPWATVAFTTLSGAVLAAKGVNVSNSLLYIGLATFGPVIGTLAGGWFIDHVRRGTALVLGAAGMALAGLLFAVADGSTALVGSGLAFNVVMSLFLPALLLFAAEAGPTAFRARVTSSAWASNRIASALAPLLLLPVLAGYGPTTMFMAVAGILAAFVAVIVGGKNMWPRS